MANGNNREHWGSMMGFILAASGSAVGLGNVWKFPYVTGQNGGAAFVIVYLICVLLLGLPIMIAELVIGRHTRKDPVGAFKSMASGTKWGLVGYLGVLSGFFILSFYSVVGGWTLGYIVKSINGIIAGIKDIESAKNMFHDFSSDPYLTLLFHLLFIASCMFIVVKGIKNGIERWSKYLMPLLFLLLFILIIKGISMEGGMKGVSFFLKPDFSKINLNSIISALGHSFFTLSLGMGAMITYGSYLSKRDKILHSAFYIVFLDTVVAILAGLAIFPSVFAMNMSPDKGPGLIFHIIPAVFGNMNYGIVYSTIFFILLFIAAITSGISLLEVVVAYIIDERGWSRRKAVYIFGISIFLLGIPSALSFGSLSNVTIFLGNNFFDFMDQLTTNYMLPIGGFFIAICLGWKYGLANTIHELDPDTRIISFKELWAFTIKFISPIVLFMLFLMLIKDDVIPIISKVLGQ
ncbi:MAG: sodium-dependent transporter [Spirochaetota bacterium]|nr:sodium-dependent transporter [Spirochaetota bacterium]